MNSNNDNDFYLNNVHDEDFSAFVKRGKKNRNLEKYHLIGNLNTNLSRQYIEMAPCRHPF